VFNKKYDDDYVNLNDCLEKILEQHGSGDNGSSHGGKWGSKGVPWVALVSFAVAESEGNVLCTSTVVALSGRCFGVVKPTAASDCTCYTFDILYNLPTVLGFSSLQMSGLWPLELATVHVVDGVSVEVVGAASRIQLGVALPAQYRRPFLYEESSECRQC